MASQELLGIMAALAGISAAAFAAVRPNRPQAIHGAFYSREQDSELLPLQPVASPCTCMSSRSLVNPVSQFHSYISPFSLVHRTQIFHIPQCQQYCRGNFSHWDPKITTFPGL